MEGTADVTPEPLPPGAVELERRAGVVDRLRDADRNVARAAAVRLERVNELRMAAEAANTGPDSDAAREDAVGATARVRFGNESELTRRSVRAELAAALRISDRAAETQLAMAEALLSELTATMDAFRNGSITERHARILWEHACQVPEADRALFEERALEAARRLSPARFAGRLREIQERLHPETAKLRHTDALTKRNVWVDPAADGMAYLTAFLPVETATAAADRLEDYARGLSSDPAETRTLPQVRADVFGDWLLNADTGTTVIRPTVQLTVPVMSLLGFSEELAILEGYGPIDLDTARRLTAEATAFTRILTHPVTGAILEFDRNRYPVTAELRAWLQMRDGTCRWPGCGRRAKHTELDHTAEWVADMGLTNFDNLAHLCTKHHKLKSRGRWKVRHIDRFGSLEWTSPLDETYLTAPAVRMRGLPHLADAVRQATLAHDPPPDPECDYNDRIPDDLYAEMQIAFDRELAGA